ncbi:MAG: hypothetical protein HY064_04670 [Bacteroidetes bacterium]|nr:hypothetical protein [Bacteroidota bacterium]
MRKLLYLIIFLLCFSSCRRKDTYPDYEGIIGKYKLVFIHEHDDSLPSDSFQLIIPSDKYEIEFRRWSKVKLIKNDKCEKTLKVYSCKAQLTGSYGYSSDFYLNINGEYYVITFPYPTNTGNIGADTLYVQKNFYPFGLAAADSNHEYYCYYIKE